MKSSSSGVGFLTPVERLLGAWFDREPGGRATLILLVLFVAASQRAAGNPLARTREIEVPNRYLGHTSATRKFLIVIVPPRALAARPPGDAAGDGALPT